MGSIAFDFLADSFLLNDDCITNGYKDYSEDQINLELDNYRKHCLSNFDALVEDVKKIDSNLKVVARNNSIDTKRILQGALYLENYVVYDPLFALTTPENKIQKTSNEFYRKDSILIKNSIQPIIANIKSIQPLVSGDYVKMLPLSHFFEPTDDAPFYYSGMKYDNDELGYEVRNYFFEKLQIDTLENVNGEWQAMPQIDRSRHAILGFGDYNHFMNYMYFDHVPRNDSHDPTKLYMVLERDATPPSQEEFEAWLQWCLYNSTIITYKEIQKHAQIASLLNALPIVSSGFESGLFSLVTDSKAKSSTSATAEALLKIELPFFDQINPTKLMSLRQTDEKLFYSFRNKLESYFYEARALTSQEDLKKLNDVFVEEVEKKELPQIKQQLLNLSKKIGVNIGIGAMGLVAAIQR